MDTVFKQPYEISLWDDRLTFVFDDGTEANDFVEIGGALAAQYYKEIKLCVIGSDTMVSPFRAVEPKLVRNTNGTSTLTFSIFTKIYNEETGEFERNPYIKYLNNERKVKLKYYPNGKLRWLDFIIKKIDESSENHKFTYTATDLFINELSKTGYKLIFDKELENNQGTVKELAARILESTDWMVGEDSELIQQTIEEPLYAINLSSALTARDIFTNEERQIESGQTIYAFNSSVNDTNQDQNYYQFIYNEDGEYIADENNIIHKVGNYYCAKSDVKGTTVFYNGFRGERYVRSQESIYDKTLEKYVKKYEKDGENFYGYVDTTYFSPSLVTNYVTNGDTIIYLSGWSQQKDGSLKIEMRPPATETSESVNRRFGIQYVQDENNAFLLNSGFRDNAEVIKEISPNQKFVFRLDCEPTEEDNSSEYRVWIGRYNKENPMIPEPSTEEHEQYTLFDFTGEFGYYVDDISLYNEKAISYEELTNITLDQIGIFITMANNDTYFIKNVEFFPQHYGHTKSDEKQGIILPNGYVHYGDSVSSEIAASQIINTYYYYKPDQSALSAEEIKYEHIGEQLSSFKPMYNSNFEKVRGIAQKETNRFNLLQTLSETFECWCRFDVWHDEEGRILLGRDLTYLIDGGTDASEEEIVFLGGDAYSVEKLIFVSDEEGSYAPYQQLKFVTFHNHIGQKKNIGFRYGINLKSITRSLDSNDIATKLIVKSNTNEFANGGSCNIALAADNPSGENFVYDFGYYIRQGLLNQENLNNDLYYYEDENTTEPRGWIGLYVKLKNLNNLRDKLIVEESGIVGRYANHKSEFENAKIQWSAKIDALEDLQDEYYDIVKLKYDGKIPEGYEKNNKIIGLVFDIERNITEIEQLELRYAQARAEMDTIESRLLELDGELREIESNTNELISNFESKYIRFIQEASWTSEDYVDDNLYYLDSVTTLHKAAHPKISYTFNVLDLSQLRGYEAYNFDIGDITYVEDTDFFGWTKKDGIKIPCREEVVITEQTILFDSPEKSTFKTQNYRSAFEDLFQRLTASSQQLQFHSGEFQRAADAIDSNGNIMPSYLEDAFSNNAYALSNVANQTVRWDEFGLTTTNETNAAEITRITSGGIFLSNNGGEKWTTGITANGINAKTITTGVLNTGLISIYNGAQKSFLWDSQGLTAYKQDESGGYSQDSYVRFDQNGIYGEDEGKETFSLTSKGLTIKNSDTTVFSADDEGNLSITGNITATTGKIGGWQVGKPHDNWSSIENAEDAIIETTETGEDEESGVVTLESYEDSLYSESITNVENDFTGYLTLLRIPKELSGIVFGIKERYKKDDEDSFSNRDVFYVTKAGHLYATDMQIGNSDDAKGSIIYGDGGLRLDCPDFSLQSSTVVLTKGEFQLKNWFSSQILIHCDADNFLLQSGNYGSSDSEVEKYRYFEPSIDAIMGYNFRAEPNGDRITSIRSGDKLRVLTPDAVGQIATHFYPYSGNREVPIEDIRSYWVRAVLARDGELYEGTVYGEKLSKTGTVVNAQTIKQTAGEGGQINLAEGTIILKGHTLTVEGGQLKFDDVIIANSISET